MHNDTRPEYDDTSWLAHPEVVNQQVFFLTRVLGPEGIIQVLEKGLNLNSPNFDETDFAVGRNELSDGDIIKPSGYGRGGGTIGTFVIFPEEARGLGVTDLHPGSAYGSQVVIPNKIEITPDTYLFVTPEELPLIKNCKSKEEALSILGSDTRGRVTQESIAKAKELLRLRDELGELLKSVTLRQLEYYLVNIERAQRTAGAHVQSNLDRYMNIHGSAGMQGIEKTRAMIEELLLLKDTLEQQEG